MLPSLINSPPTRSRSEAIVTADPSSLTIVTATAFPVPYPPDSTINRVPVELSIITSFACTFAAKSSATSVATVIESVALSVTLAITYVKDL